jgi:hypothetical protein
VDQVIKGRNSCLITVTELIRYSPRLAEAKKIARAAMAARWDW